MKPKLVNSFNKDEENYLKFEVKYIDSSAYEEVLVKFLEELGFIKPFYPKISNKSEEEDFTKKTYKQRIGFHKFLENEKFKIHVIFSEDHLNLVLKCSQKNKNAFVKLLGKHFDLF